MSSHFASEWASRNAHYLLGYNEPDYGNGHNHPHMCSPAAAAADWPNLQASARDLVAICVAMHAMRCDDATTR